MQKLSLKKYAVKCVLGMEIIYFLCLFGGLVLPRKADLLHRSIFETIPGFTWLTPGSVIWGAILSGIFAWIFGLYMVWMYNTSLINGN